MLITLTVIFKVDFLKYKFSFWTKDIQIPQPYVFKIPYIFSSFAQQGYAANSAG